MDKEIEEWLDVYDTYPMGFSTISDFLDTHAQAVDVELVDYDINKDQYRFKVVYKLLDRYFMLEFTESGSVRNIIDFYEVTKGEEYRQIKVTKWIK